MSAVEATAESEAGDFCRWEMTQGSVWMDVRLGGARLRLKSTQGACAAAEPWNGPDRPSPEGWVARLGFLLRLRYDVLSLNTPVQYELCETEGKEKYSAVIERDECADGSRSTVAAPLSLPIPPWRPGALHLEKNWGTSFPDQWIWAQGHQSGSSGQVKRGRSRGRKAALEKGKRP